MAALQFENVSKVYKGSRDYGQVRDDLGAALKLLRRGRAPRRAIRALDGVSFEIREGESTAIIGRNGHGKTTTLKLATRIAYPTSGRLRVRGRVGALIEVGTGMHPELTGRENVALYGRILGLTRRDVASRFDEIADFAGIGAAIDQPLKQYSSGMQLRLGFSVAAHLEPDVLLVDEAIAVGDAGFQQKCVERMKQLVREGRTLVFVSHDVAAVESLCTRALLLSHGRLVDDGPAHAVVGRYLEGFEDERIQGRATSRAHLAGVPQLEIRSVSLADDAGNAVDEVSTGDPVVVRVEYEAHAPVSSPCFTVGLSDGRSDSLAIASMQVDGESPQLLHGRGVVECRFEHLPLRPRSYEVWCSVRHESDRATLVAWQPMLEFRVVGAVPAIARGPVLIPYEWRFGDDN